jgi:hypothetical protein
MKLPHKQSNLHCHHKQNKQTKLHWKAEAYKRTRESNNEDGRLCFRLWHNLSLEHKLLKPKPGSIILPQMENIPWWFPQGRKHEQTLENRRSDALRSAPPPSKFSKPSRDDDKRKRTRAREQTNPLLEIWKFPASARDLTAFTQDQSFGIFLNAFKRLLLIMETSWHLVYPLVLGLDLKSTVS